MMRSWRITVAVRYTIQRIGVHREIGRGRGLCDGGIIGGMNEADWALVRRAQRGDRDAVTTVITRYQGYVYRTAYGIVQYAADAEDVTQETFLKMYRSFQTLHDVRTFPSWLARIATRTALDRVAQRERTHLASPDVLEATAAPDAVHRSDLQIDVARALADLTPAHRAVLVLREVYGFDYAELAQILDVPVGTVRSRLHHARMQLRTALDAPEEGGSR